MHRPSSSELLKNKESYYSLVIAVAKRARELVDDAEVSGKIIVEKPVSIAVREFENGSYQLIEKSNIGNEIE